MSTNDIPRLISNDAWEFYTIYVFVYDVLLSHSRAKMRRSGRITRSAET